MNTTLQVLFIEDSENDAELTLYELKRYGYLTYSERIESYTDMKNALTTKKWDVILSDNYMPNFSALEALNTRNELAPNIPFIIITGNLDDDLMNQARQFNCKSFFLKGHLENLGEAISLYLLDR